MFKIKEKLHPTVRLLVQTFIVVAVFLGFLNYKTPERSLGNEPSYTITLNSDNTPDVGVTYTHAEKLVRYTNFEYTSARSSVGNHVELNSNGYLNNKNDSQITSITSIAATFTSTGGTLTLATSYDGINYTQTQIASGETNFTSSEPYHFRLTANGAPVAIKSVIITYSCAPHGAPENEQSYDITVKDFSANNTSDDISSSLFSNKNTYFTSDINLTSIDGSKIFANQTPTATNLKFGSSSATGYITFGFASMNVSRVIVSAYKYASDTVSIKVTSSSDNTGETIAVNASVSTNYTFTLNGSSNATSLRIEGVGKRFHLEKLTLISSGAATNNPIETGFYATDSNANNYSTNDIYANVNQISASVAMSSGSPKTLNYDASGLNGYKYTLKNSSNNIVSATTKFATPGTYFVEVSYKAYPLVRIELLVSDVVVPTVTEVIATDGKSEYQIGDIYNNVNNLVVTAVLSDATSLTLSYDPNGVTGYTIYCLDSNLDEVYTNSPFTLPGDYILTVTYKGVESNDVEFTVKASSGSTSDATINVLANEVLDGTIITNPKTYLSASGVSISTATASYVYGGAGDAKLRFSSSKYAGSLTINFSETVQITSITLRVSRYNDNDTVAVKVATSANSTGQALTLTSGVQSLSYTAFTGDTQKSSSLTVSSPAGNRFFLYGIDLTIGQASPIALTGISLKTATTIPNGSSETLTPTFIPANASNKNVTWQSSNPAVASVSNGVVTANSVGSATITVTSVDGGFSASCAVTVTAVTYNNYYRASTVDPNFNLQDIQQNQDLDSIPSPLEDLNILVIPIELTDYPFTTKTLTDLEILFNGSAEDTKYWESVSSFYDKSSFGNLDISFTVAPKYNTGYTARTASELNTASTQYFSTNLLRNAVSDYKNKNGNTSTRQFDADGNGYIDAVWMIYSCPNYSNSTAIRNITSDYWAYVFWDYNQSSSTTSPNANNYGWASYDFMYEGGGTSKVDAHTYIHETGHLLGLDDYYNYDDNSNYKPTGGIDMMDYNVTDHNVWSKMTLGWIKPYVVTGNAEITISPAQDNGDAILIADSWNGTSFDEFLILELYTPTKLNALDSSNAYNGSYPRGYTIPGIRLYHVDSRLGRFTYSSSLDWYMSNYAEPTSLNLTGNNFYGLAHSNTPSYSANGDYRLIHMIQAGGSNTFKTGSNGSNTDLFTTGKTFSMATYGSQFFKNATLLNNGNALGYTIQFISVSQTSATIRILRA